MPEFKIPCFLYGQRQDANAPRFALFAAKASEILQWATVRRRHQEKEGAQRRLSGSKIQAIKKFLESNSLNTIPPAVTVTLDESAIAIETLPEVPANDGIEFGVLTVEVADTTPMENRPGLVIDGQHRLYGADAFDRDFVVNVVALLTNDSMEQAFQFLVINNKVSRVPTDHLRTLVLDYQKEELGKRLRAARITLDPNLKYVGIIDTDDESPFRGYLALVSEQKDEERRFVPPAAIEAAIDVIQQQRVPELEREDELCNFFYSIWRPISQKWQQLWIAPPDSKLMYKVSIVAMTAHMTDGLIARYDLEQLDVMDPKAVEKEAEKMLQFLTLEFWTSEWKIKISDSKAVRDALVQALKDISRNMRAGRAWHEGLDDFIIL